MAVTPIAGRSGRVQFGGVNWNFDDCDVVFKVNLQETTGFEDQAADGTTTVNRATGNIDFEGTISGPVDSGFMLEAPPGGAQAVKPGSVLTDLRIYLDKAVANRYCGCNFVVVESINYHPKQADAAQRVTVKVKAGGATGIANKVQVVRPT